MAHHLYVTPGFVLDSKNMGEANKLFYLFTRDLGLVIGTAQGVRHLKSKLRYHIQHFSFGVYSLVHGKEIWRITGAKEGDTEFAEIKENPEVYYLYARILSLLKQLLTGEEKHTELFETVYTSFAYLKNANLSEELLGAFERIVVVRILNHLGYVHGKDTITQFVENDSFTEGLMMSAVNNKAKLIEVINASLKASQLL